MSCNPGWARHHDALALGMIMSSTKPGGKRAGLIMTAKEVAEYLRVHPSTIYRQLRLRSIPAFKVGADWRFNRDSIDRWMLERERRQRGGPEESHHSPRQ